MDEREFKDRYAAIMRDVRPTIELNEKTVAYVLENIKPSVSEPIEEEGEEAGASQGKTK